MNMHTDLVTRQLYATIELQLQIADNIGAREKLIHMILEKLLTETFAKRIRFAIPDDVNRMGEAVETAIDMAKTDD